MPTFLKSSLSTISAHYTVVKVGERLRLCLIKLEPFNFRFVTGGELQYPAGKSDTVQPSTTFCFKKNIRMELLGYWTDFSHNSIPKCITQPKVYSASSSSSQQERVDVDFLRVRQVQFKYDLTDIFMLCFTVLAAGEVWF